MDAKTKTHFVIVDCVGVCDLPLVDHPPLERNRAVSFETLLKQVAFGNTDPEVLSSVASRLSRMEKRLGKPELKQLAEAAGGKTLSDMVGDIVKAIDPDRQIEAAREKFDLPEDAKPTDEQIKDAATDLLKDAAAPIVGNPEFRNMLIEFKTAMEQTIDEISRDEVVFVGVSEDSKEKARQIIESFEKYIEENRDEITAFQVLYSVPYSRRLKYEDIRELADLIKTPPRNWTPELLWRAYETLEKDKVRGASGQRLLTDIVSLVKFAIHRDDELVPFVDKVRERFDQWLAQQQNAGKEFTAAQLEWLELIRDHIAASVSIDMTDFDQTPFAQKGGAGKAYQLFGNELDKLLIELNEVLAA